ncbi:hypothetical protein BDQ17DRAFT_680318 [Cyathus striatus]|nr:hypothetical protein BDQ17DRAFT_680318 [Cyathus striatus]
MSTNGRNDFHKNENYDAEAAGPHKSIYDVVPCLRRQKKTKGDNKKPSRKQVKDWEKQFKPDAKIWELYLKDAEEEARENAEVWKNGLDSLLIFAGLFAGVVSSFVTSVGSGSSDSRQALPSDLWIKGLWATSLLVTLFSAVMGVLAKAWSVKFIPVSSKREAKDAYQRRILDKRAKRWQLERVIKFIPLLIQIAAFLFAAGLQYSRMSIISALEN